MSALIKKVNHFLLVAVLTFSGAKTYAAASAASDNAGDPAYAGGTYAGLNGGAGFGAWNVQLDPNGRANILGGPVFNLTSPTMGSVAYVNAIRPFTGGALGSNETFVTSVLLGGGASGARLGWELQDASGNVLFNFYQIGNDPCRRQRLHRGCRRARTPTWASNMPMKSRKTSASR